MGKEKKHSLNGSTAVDGDEPLETPYEEKLKFASQIAKPMAGKKLTKKLYKLIRKASKDKNNIRSGLRDVQTKIRKGEKGLAIMAGNVTPIDVMCHMPAVCEGKEIPYAYVPSRFDMGAAFGVKRGILIVLVKPGADYQQLYEECCTEVGSLPIPD